MQGEMIGHFKVLSRLGCGGMGEVWLAEHHEIRTKVAIKLLLRHVSEDVEHVQRFFNEARAVRRIPHAGIVKIFDVGHHDGQAYLVMEYLEGETLAKRITRTTRMSLVELCEVGRQIASVLDATHGSGITHRDLKPENIFIVADRELPRGERVKILDFGIAKLSGTLTSLSPRTTGTLGTPAYMAPEQWADAALVDWRADLYALGCVLFEMACGRPPFVATSIADACAKHLHDDPPCASSIEPTLPAAFDELLARLLAKSPSARPGSMREVAAALDAIVSGDRIAFAATVSTGDQSAPTPTSAPPAPSRRPWVLALAGTVAIAATAVAVERPGTSAAAAAPAEPHAVVAPRTDTLAIRATVAPPPAPSEPARAPAPTEPAPAPAAAPRARPTAEKEGEIDGAAVFEALRANARIQACYLAEVVKNPALGGKLMASLVIGLDGRARKVKAVGLNDAVASCVTDALAAMTFPRPVGGPVTANIPMSFDPPDAGTLERGGALRAEVRGSGELPSTPSLTALHDVMTALAPQLAVCHADSWGSEGRIEILVRPDGHVGEAKVIGGLEATDAGACVEQAVREHARFPPSKLGIRTTQSFTLTAR